LGAATLTAVLLAIVAGVSQLPVLAFGKLFVGHAARTQSAVRLLVLCVEFISGKKWSCKNI
jgi:hypothetical protein